MRTPSLRSTLAAAVLLAAGLAPAVARADAVSDAKDLFARGRELRTHGDCASAVGMFRKAYELYPAGLGSLRNLAECEESLGHFASARRAWLDLKRALLTNSDSKYEGWAQDATDAAARLAPKLATLTVDVRARTPEGQPVASPGGVDVTLNGEKLEPAVLGAPLERDPGHYVLRATGPGVQASQERSVDLSAGDVKRVGLEVVVPAQSASTSAPAGTTGTAGAGGLPEEPPPVSEDDGASTRRTLGWVAVGLGVASLAGAGVSLAVRQSALNEVNDSCGSHQGCDPSLQSTVSRGQTASTLVSVFSAVGGVALVGGIVLLATSGHGHSQQATLLVQPTLGGASARWSF